MLFAHKLTRNSWACFTCNPLIKYPAQVVPYMHPKLQSPRLVYPCNGCHLNSVYAPFNISLIRPSTTSVKFRFRVQTLQVLLLDRSSDYSPIQLPTNFTDCVTTVLVRPVLSSGPPSCFYQLVSPKNNAPKFARGSLKMEAHFQQSATYLTILSL